MVTNASMKTLSNQTKLETQFWSALSRRETNDMDDMIWHMQAHEMSNSCILKLRTIVDEFHNVFSISLGPLPPANVEPMYTEHIDD